MYIVHVYIYTCNFSLLYMYMYMYTHMYAHIHCTQASIHKCMIHVHAYSVCGWKTVWLWTVSRLVIWAGLLSRQAGFMWREHSCTLHPYCCSLSLNRYITTCLQTFHSNNHMPQTCWGIYMYMYIQKHFTLCIYMVYKPWPRDEYVQIYTCLW